MRQANRRIRLVVAIFAVVFGVALVRVTWLQGVRASALGQLGTSQHRETLAVPSHRGTIYDRLGAYAWLFLGSALVAFMGRIPAAVPAR